MRERVLVALSPSWNRDTPDYAIVLFAFGRTVLFDLATTRHALDLQVLGFGEPPNAAGLWVVDFEASTADPEDSPNPTDVHWRSLTPLELLLIRESAFHLPNEEVAQDQWCLRSRWPRLEDLWRAELQGRLDERGLAKRMVGEMLRLIGEVA